MSDNQHFFVCEHCGNLSGLIHDSGVPMYCCGQPMKQLQANPQGYSKEKHQPVVTKTGNTVSVDVGEVTHPMTEDHAIPWVYLQTTHGGQRKCLMPGEPPTASFALDHDEAVAAFSYCNQHGLWKTDLV